jgi:hypothetical protein
LRVESRKWRIRHSAKQEAGAAAGPSRPSASAGSSTIRRCGDGWFMRLWLSFRGGLLPLPRPIRMLPRHE